MTLFSYEIFDAVARQGSFNKAAQQLHLTPSAISHAIAVMEAELGFTLFNRGKNGVTMTSYGASLYPSIRAVLNSDEALQQSIARLNGLEKGKVKLGAFNSVCAGLLPQILKSFMASYPQIEVEVYQGTYDDVKEWLRTGQVAPLPRHRRPVQHRYGGGGPRHLHHAPDAAAQLHGGGQDLPHRAGRVPGGGSGCPAPHGDGSGGRADVPPHRGLLPPDGPAASLRIRK